jgi:hypothetical protein
MLTVVTDYDYVFSENGLVAYENGKLIGNQVWISLLHYHHTWVWGMLGIMVIVLLVYDNL